MRILHIWHGWFLPLFLFCAALVFSNGIHWILFKVLRKKADQADDKDGKTVGFGKGLGLHRYLGRPARAIFFVTCLFFVQPFIPVPEHFHHLVRQGLAIAFVVSLGWFAIGSVYVVQEVLYRRYDISVADNVHARRFRTQFQLLRRLVITLLIVLTIAGVAYTFHDARIWRAGTGLLASAGLASLVLAAAAKSTVSNFLAGLQIALTQPIRIDDVVIVQGEYGNVEEINSAFVVIRCWDLRRLIVPLSYFIENSFQNWTRESANILGSAFLYLDYCVPVDALRTELERICNNEGKKYWDGKVVNLQVTDLKEHTMEVRCLVSSSNAGSNSDLRSLIRERMITFIRENYPDALPQTRVTPLRQFAEKGTQEPPQKLSAA